MQNEFTITKDRLDNTDTLATMTLENEHYTVKIYYTGDFYKDKSEGGLNPHKLSVTIKPKKTSLDMTMLGTEPYIKDPELEMFPAKDADKIIQKIIGASENAGQLKAKIEEICGPIREWDDTNME